MLAVVFIAPLPQRASAASATARGRTPAPASVRQTRSLVRTRAVRPPLCCAISHVLSVHSRRSTAPHPHIGPECQVGFALLCVVVLGPHCHLLFSRQYLDGGPPLGSPNFPVPGPPSPVPSSWPSKPHPLAPISCVSPLPPSSLTGPFVLAKPTPSPNCRTPPSTLLVFWASTHSFSNLVPHFRFRSFFPSAHPQPTVLHKVVAVHPRRSQGGATHDNYRQLPTTLASPSPADAGAIVG